VDVPRPAAPGRGLRFRTWKNHAKIMGTSWKKTWEDHGKSWKNTEKNMETCGNRCFFGGKYGKKHAASTVNEKICCLKMV